MIKIKQHDASDCGAACIASVAAHYKLDLPVSRIRQLASTDSKGTNVLGLLEALAKLDFEAKGVKGEFNSLFQIPTPAIAHVITDAGLHHFVVVCKTTKNFIEVMDPAYGEAHRYRHEEFKKLWTGVLIILLPAETFKPAKHRTPVITRFWQVIKPHHSILLQTLAGALVYTVIGLSTSIYVQKIVDYVLVDGNKNLLNLMSIGMIILLLLQMFISTAKNVFTLRTGQLVDAHLILSYYKHILHLPQQFFDNMRVGEILSRINDAVKIRAFLNDVSINLAVNVFVVIFSMLLMFSYYWKLAVIVALAIPMYGLMYWISNKLNKKVERVVMEQSADLESHLVESLGAMSTIKSLGLEHFSGFRTESKFITLLKSVYQSGLNTIFSSVSTEFLSRLFTIVVLWIGAGYVLNQTITPGDLLSFYALTGFFAAPAAALIGMNKVLQHALIAADRLFEIMDLEIEKNTAEIILTPAVIGDVTFKNVHFRYGSKVTVFEDLNLIFQKGCISAVVGESGSGKSTLVSIIQKLYPIHAGSVSIGNHDLKYLDTGSLRKVIGSVPQRVDLFAGNVIENIAVGDPNPDLKKIISVCAALGCLEFIEQLPQGFQTPLGENGVNLSGGQCQRIAIARALYRDPEILILDEATSSLDSSAEQHVLQLLNYMKDMKKTVIVIAHRLSTVRLADKIIVLQRGVLVEEGTHDQLIANRKNYYELWSQQFPMVETIASFERL